MPRPTVYDVAARAGVSIATVSRVLSRPDDVAPGTRDRVAAVVAELGFVPNASARGLAGSRTRVIGLILPARDEDEPAGVNGDDGAPRIVDDRDGSALAPSSENLYYDEIVRGAERAAGAADHALIIAAGSPGSRDRLLNEVAVRVDGLVLVSSATSPVPARTPVVHVAGSGPHDGDRVNAANAAGMRTVVECVLAHDRVRRIAYLDGPADSPDGRERRAGVEEAVAAARASGRELELTILPGEFSEGSGAASARALIAQGDPPEAIVCANDQSALGVLGVLRRAGIDVPGRVLVTGFDGVEASGHTSPRLTTVRQPMADLGLVAVRMLLERIADPSAAPVSRTLPVEVLLRESCPPAE